jgi:putative tryptophan/tyrosine transport system substrate-binding protein
MPVVGFLSIASDASFAHLVAGFRPRPLGSRLRRGSRNVVVEYRWAEGSYERLPALAADLVLRRVAVIVASACGYHTPSQEH